MFTRLDNSTLEALLHWQIQVAWAGEGLCDPKRLGWWRTDLVDENTGGDLLARLAPRTHRWAALRAVREAARLTDQQARANLANPDRYITLFHWGFEVDEQLEDHLRDCTLTGAPVPEFGGLDQLTRAWQDLPPAKFEAQASGRQLKGPMPADLKTAAQQLVAALLPRTDKYPLPHFLVSGQ